MMLRWRRPRGPDRTSSGVATRVSRRSGQAQGAQGVRPPPASLAPTATSCGHPVGNGNAEKLLYFHGHLEARVSVTVDQMRDSAGRHAKLLSELRLRPAPTFQGFLDFCTRVRSLHEL